VEKKGRCVTIRDKRHRFCYASLNPY